MGCGADGQIELTRIRVADSEVKVIRANNYVKTLEEAFKKAPSGAEIEAELGRAREELSGALREREEGEAEQRLSEVWLRQTVVVRENEEDRREMLIFCKVSFWQHMATYLLYFVMLMNVFITTFGISGGGGVVGYAYGYAGAGVGSGQVIVASTGGAAVTPSTTLMTAVVENGSSAFDVSNNYTSVYQ